MPPRCRCGLDPAASSLPPSSISWATPESPKPDVQTRSVAHRLCATSDASDVAAAMAFGLHRETSQELVFTPVSAMPPMSSRARRADRHGPDSPVPLKIRQLKDCIAQYHCGRGSWCGMPITAWDDDVLYGIVCRLMQSLAVLRAHCVIPAAKSLQLPHPRRKALCRASFSTCATLSVRPTILSSFRMSVVVACRSEAWSIARRLPLQAKAHRSSGHRRLHQSAGDECQVEPR